MKVAMTEVVTEMFKRLGTLIKDSFVTVGKHIWESVAPSIFQPLDDMFAGALAKYSDFVMDVEYVWVVIGHTVDAFFSALESVFVSGWGTLWQNTKDGLSGMKDDVSGWMGDVWALYTEMFLNAGNIFTLGWSALGSNTWSGLVAMKDKIVQFVSNIYNAGRDLANALVDGFKDAMRNAATSLWNTVRDAFGPIGGFFKDVGGAFTGGGGGSSPPGLPPAMPVFGFAKGGIIRSPTLGLLGEAGPEAVVPLDQMPTGLTVVNNFYVDTGLSSPAETAEAIESLLSQHASHKGSLDFLEYN